MSKQINSLDRLHFSRFSISLVTTTYRNKMVFTIAEILEKSQREANGVSFEDALERTSELVERV